MKSEQQPRERRRGWTALAAALSAGLALRLFFLLRFPTTAGDPRVYIDYARTLLEHHVYGYTRTMAGVEHAVPSLMRLPGYPLFLAGCFALFGHTSVKAVLLVQAFVDLLTCGLAALTAARLFGSRAGWWALWLAVLCPFTATYVAAPLTETPVLFTIACAFYVLVRWRQSGGGGWLLLLAAALGYSILLRPDQGLLAAAVIPALLAMSPSTGWQRVRPALLTAILTLLPLVPWTVRNEHTFHVFQPLAPRSATDPGELVPTGFNRWFRTWGWEYASNETAYWNYNSDEIHMADLPARAFDSPAQRIETEDLLDRYNETTTETPALDAQFEHLAEARIRGHRFRYWIELPLLRVVDMLFRPRTELLPVFSDWWKPHPDGQTRSVVMALLYGALNLVYFGLALAGWTQRSRLLLSRSLQPVLWAMAASILLRLLLLATLDNAEPRYTLEFYPVLFVLAGGWLAAVSARRQRNTVCSESRTGRSRSGC